MPLWLILLGGGALLAYLVKQGQAQAAALSVGQTAYTVGVTTMNVSGGTVALAAGTRVYVQTADSSGSTMVRTDSGNVGTVPTSSLSATLPPGITMQVN
jgi:hypothetical protein